MHRKGNDENFWRSNHHHSRIRGALRQTCKNCPRGKLRTFYCSQRKSSCRCHTCATTTSNRILTFSFIVSRFYFNPAKIQSIIIALIFMYSSFSYCILAIQYFLERMPKHAMHSYKSNESLMNMLLVTLFDQRTS